MYTVPDVPPEAVTAVEVMLGVADGVANVEYVVEVT